MKPQQFFTHPTPAPVLVNASNPLVHRFSDNPIPAETRNILQLHRKCNCYNARLLGRLVHRYAMIAHSNQHCERMNWMIVL
jgi:hypothetical protein